MKMTMRLTLDGMRRALRWKTHQLAEDAERGYLGAAQVDRDAAPPARRGRREAGKEHNDDRSGS